MLRAKYLDWCSARLAARFIKLTPEEIYALAERTLVGSPVTVGVASEADALESERETLSFRAIVERVTEALAGELSLPSFEEWAFAYRTEPERFEEAMLGLWKDRIEE